jgi:hypothetical protein
MSKRIKVINNSGIRFPKKTNTNQFDLTAFGYNVINETYYALPIEIGIDNNQIAPTSIGTQVNSLSIITTSIISPEYGNDNVPIFGTVISDGGLTITRMGAVWNTTGNPTLSDNVNIYGGAFGVGDFSTILTSLPNGETVYAKTFIEATGTTSGQTITEIVYGGQLTTIVYWCFAEGTLVTLSDFTHKKIEDITYEDNLLVWNFDEGKFDSSKPLWISEPSLAFRYSLSTFSNGTELKSLSPLLGHRIFNVEDGRFSHVMKENTPIGTHTFTEKNGQIELINKEIVVEEAIFYNIITDYHMNIFANGILTSCGLNNLYPVKDMKFVKNEKELKTKEMFTVSEEVFNGLRFSEQDMNVETLEQYVSKRHIGQKILNKIYNE